MVFCNAHLMMQHNNCLSFIISHTSTRYEQAQVKFHTQLADGVIFRYMNSSSIPANFHVFGLRIISGGKPQRIFKDL